MNLIIFLLILSAFVLALLAAFNKPSKFNLIGSALACYFASILVRILWALF